MDPYLITLYLHFLAFAGAIAATALLHFNVMRLRGAPTVGDARAALALVARTAPFMPLFALALFATGAYLVHLRWPWNSGWVIAGIVGLLSMPVASAVTLRPRLVALSTRLRDAADGPVDSALAASLNDRVMWGVMHNNHTMVLAVVLVMVMKPSLSASFAILLVAPVVGFLSAYRTRL